MNVYPGMIIRLEDDTIVVALHKINFIHFPTTIAWLCIVIKARQVDLVNPFIYITDFSKAVEVEMEFEWNSLAKQYLLYLKEQ